MASIERRVRNGQTAYVCRWRAPDGRQATKSFARKVDALRFRAGLEADIVRGQFIDPHEATTVLDYAREWAEGRPHRPATATRVRSHIETHIAGTRLGSRRLAEVRPSEVQAWASDRARVLAPTTVRNLVGLLRSIFASAILDRLVASSPVSRVSLPRAERPRIVPLRVEQVSALAATARAQCRAMVIAQAGLGLRLGELLALRACDVDFLRRVVRVEGQITSGTRERSEPKTPRSRRTLPLPTFVADALAAHMAAYPPGGDGSLFTSASGLPYRQDHYARVFETARKLAGLPEGTTSHDLRHHYPSVLLAAGESVVAVAERLGHENANLVLSTYGHLMPDSEERTRRALDDAWSCVTDVYHDLATGP